jgi:hypothetical protein
VQRGPVAVTVAIIHGWGRRLSAAGAGAGAGADAGADARARAGEVSGERRRSEEDRGCGWSRDVVGFVDSAKGGSWNEDWGFREGWHVCSVVGDGAREWSVGSLRCLGSVLVPWVVLLLLLLLLLLMVVVVVVVVVQRVLLLSRRWSACLWHSTTRTTELRRRAVTAGLVGGRERIEA